MRTVFVLVIVFVIYGSFYPFDYVPHTATFADLAELFFAWPEHVSLIDAVGNILLFAPFGLLVPPVSKRQRPALLLAGIALAWLIQYVQFWFPSRVPCGSDAWFNTAGIAIGYGLAFALRRFTERIHALADQAPPLWPVASALLLIWVAYRWFPLVPTVDPQNIKHGLKPLFLSFHWESAKVLHDAVAWLVFFRLIRYSPLQRWHALWAGLAAVGILLFEPFIVNNDVSWSNVIGLAAALLCRPWFAKGQKSLFFLICLLMLSLIYSGLSPFAFGPNADFHWLPFAGMLDGSMFMNLDALIEKVYLYGSLLFLMRHFGLRSWPASMTVAALLLGIEIVQQWLPGHTPEITDPLLALLIGFCLKEFGKEQKTIEHRRTISTT